jgi:hypothetical protein
MLEKTVTRSLLVRRSDRQDVREARRVRERVAFLAIIPGGGDDQQAGPEGVQDRVFLDRDPGDAAEAEVDHSAAAAPRSGEAGDLVSDRQHAVGARVPELQLRLRVDPDDSLGVHGRGGDRGGRGPVRLVAVPRLERLGVQREGVGPAGELLVREVDARVDHRQRHPGAGRDPVRGSDVRRPPFRGRERVAELAEEAARVAGVGADRDVRHDGTHEPSALELRKQPLRLPAREAPEPE